MALPWLQILDAVIGVTDIVRSRKIKSLAGAPPPSQQLEHQLEAAGRGTGGALEARLAGVVVAALKEAFDRDARRIEFEREQAAAERERAERALRLELQRQAGDREIGRLRLLAGVAIAAWIGTLVFSARVLGGSVAARVMLGGGWALLLAAFAAAFTAQSKVAEALAALARDDGAGVRQVTSGAAGVLALWLIVAGLALVALAVLIA
jgi:hypothetical protein